MTRIVREAPSYFDINFINASNSASGEGGGTGKRKREERRSERRAGLDAISRDSEESLARPEIEHRFD